MAVEVKELRHPGTNEVEGVVFKCTTSGLVFGPVMEFSADDAEACLQWITKKHGDPRTLPPADVAKHYLDFLEIRKQLAHALGCEPEEVQFRSPVM